MSAGCLSATFTPQRQFPVRRLNARFRKRDQPFTETGSMSGLSPEGPTPVRAKGFRSERYSDGVVFFGRFNRLNFIPKQRSLLVVFALHCLLQVHSQGRQSAFG